MMKKITLLLFLLTAVVGYSQNLISNGTFDDDTGWTVVNQYGTDSTNGSVTFSGGNANIDKIDASDGGWIHMGFYTSVDLTAGWYQFDMDMSFDGIGDIWGEVYIGMSEPTDNSEYSGDLQVIKSYNAWDCSPNTYTGLAVAYGCDDSSPGKFEITTTGTYYLLFRSGGGNFGSLGITLDNFTLFSANPAPVAGFSETTSESNLSATFANSSTDATSYSWDFGNGSGISTDENPSYTYAYKGQYVVSLTATSSEGSNVSYKEIYVGAVSTPISEFNFDFNSSTPLRGDRVLDYEEDAGIGTVSGVNKDWWSQIVYVHDAGVDLSTGDRGFSINVKGLRTSTVTIKVEDGGDAAEVAVDYTTPNAWQELRFDFSSFTSNSNKKIALFFDIATNYDDSVDPSLNIFQIDDYVFGKFATLSIKDFQIEGLTAYPNPTTNQWMISTKDQVINSIDVYNVLGKRVLSVQPKALSAKVDASGLTPGMYISTITTDLGTTSRKLIKK